MSGSIRNLARLAVGLGISAVAVWLLLRSLNLDALGTALAEANLAYFPLAVALYFVGAWLRSIRWGWLLPQPAPPVSTLFSALVVGFTINNLIPARVGELARAYLLHHWRGVPYGATLASLVVERILDGLVLALLLVGAVIITPSAPDYVLVIAAVVGTGFGGAALLVFLTTWRESLVLRLAGWVGGLLPRRFSDLAGHVLAGFLEGLRVVRGPVRLVQLAVISVVAWCCELGVFWVLVFGFPLPHDVGIAFLAGAVGNFATLIPSSPGYVGTFDGAIARVMADTAHAPEAVSTAYAILVHAAVLVPVVILGLIILWRSGLGISQVTSRARRQMADVETEAEAVATAA